MVAECSCMSME